MSGVAIARSPPAVARASGSGGAHPPAGVTEAELTLDSR